MPVMKPIERGLTDALAHGRAPRWLAFHRESEVLADKAHDATRRFHFRAAQKFYQAAAENEELALEELSTFSSALPRTYGVIAVSTVALFLKAGCVSKSKALIKDLLGAGGFPRFAIKQLREIQVQL